MSRDTEDTPLLASTGLDHEVVYKRFAPREKRSIVALVSFSALLPLFVTGSFIPSIPDIAKDFDSTAEVISLAVSLSVLANAFGSLVWAAYSAFYGRRVVYILSLTCQCIGSLGVASSRTIPQLLALRIVQAFGTSSGLSIGIAVIGDIYKLEERGAASGVFFGCVLLGPALAPVVGGIAAQYWSWRVMQLLLLAAGAIILTLVVLFLPETAHPGTRGIEKAQERGVKARWVWLNPFKSLTLLRSPNVTIVAVASGLAMLTEYALLVPIAYTMGARYGINNAAIVGMLFIPNGLGNLVGAPLSGKLSDKILVKMRAERGGVWVPEDRLRVTLIGASVMAPLAVLLSGIFITYVDGTLGIVLNLFCLFTTGVGLTFILIPSSAYAVDILHSRSAEVSAATMALRGLIIATSTSGVMPMINQLGVFRTYTITAVIGWIAFGLLWTVIRYGDRLRASVDMGYSNTHNN